LRGGVDAHGGRPRAHVSAHPLEPRSSRSRVDGLATSWRDAWGAPTPEAFAKCCLLHVQYEDPLAPEPLEGTIALCDHVDRLHKAFPDLRIEPSGQAIGEGTFACVPWRAIGTQKGELGALPASDRFMILHGLHYLELEGGRVRRARGGGGTSRSCRRRCRAGSGRSAARRRRARSAPSRRATSGSRCEPRSRVSTRTSWRRTRAARTSSSCARPGG